MTQSAGGADADELMTALEAAAYLRIHPVTLAKWRGRNSSVIGPEFERAGRKIIYRKSVIDAWLKLPGSKVGA